MIEKAIQRALSFLAAGPKSATEVGFFLYGQERRPGFPWQSYARPGGRVLHVMARKGLVREMETGRRRLWKLDERQMELFGQKI